MAEPPGPGGPIRKLCPYPASRGSKERLRRAGARIEAEVFVIEPLGSEVIVDLIIGGNMIKMRAPPDFRPHAGEKIHITFNKDKMHIYDKKTGKAIT